MAQRAETDEDSPRSGDRSRQGGMRWMPSVQIIGVAFVLFILAGYFAWMIVEMGAHAVPKAWPMVAVLVASVGGAIAATLGMLVGRRTDESRKD